MIAAFLIDDLVTKDQATSKGNELSVPIHCAYVVLSSYRVASVEIVVIVVL